MTHYGVGIFTGAKSSKRWIRWSRPPSYWDVAVPHLFLAGLTGIPLLVSFLLPLNSLSLVPCTFLWLTGYPCPFCGFTRSIWAFSAGDWTFALQNAPLSGVIYLLFAGVFIWNAAALIAGVRIRRGPMLILNHRQTNWIITFISVLFLINWVYRLSLGLK
jgi:hypothetical protein